VNLVADVSEVWLPLEKYLNGLLLMVWPDAYWTPRASTFVASCVLVVVVYGWVYLLTDRIEAAEVATGLVAVQPWYLWLSSTPMLEMYYLTCFLAGLAFLTRWLQRGTGRDWFYAGCCLMAASGFHVQSWTLINLLNLLTVGYWGRFAMQRNWRAVARLSGFYGLGNALILLLSAVEYFATGTAFGFLARHTAYSKWFYGGYTASLGEKLLYYPGLMLEHIHFAVFVLAVIGLGWVVRSQSVSGRYLPLGLGVLALLLNSLLNVVSVPPTAAPGRYSLFYLLMMAPYAAMGVTWLMSLGSIGQPGSVRAAGVVVALVALVMVVGQGLRQLPDYPAGVSRDAVDAGDYLEELLRDAEPRATFMVELAFWDFLGVELAAGHYVQRVYDREFDLYDREKPSLLLGAPDQVLKDFRHQNVRFVALRDDALAEHLPFLSFLRGFGGWRVYAVAP
jgi:hypothetical protein